MAGLNEFGFEKATLLEIKSEVEESLRLGLGEAINLLPESVLGQLNGILAERYSKLWDLAEAVYDSQYPDTAFGISLDNVVRLTGTERAKAQKSRVQSQILFGTAGTPVPAGTIVSVNGNSAARFLTDTAVTLVTGLDTVQRVAFSAVPTSGVFKLSFKGLETASLGFSALAGDVQAALNALDNLSGVVVAGSFAAGFTITFSGDDGKQVQALLTVPLNSLMASAVAVVITPSILTAGVPQGSTTMTAESSGATTAPLGTLSIIETTVPGLSRTFNTMPADVGSAVESDAALRLRRETELQNAGSATVEAIRARVRSVPNVTQAIVFENDDNIPDLDGRPPHSIEAFVQGGADQAIRDTLWLAKGGGIYTVGAIVGTITDSQGIAHTIRFSRPIVVPIYVTIKVTKDSSAPADIAAQVRNVLASYLGSLEIGQDIIVYPTLVAQLTKISGIVDVELGIAITPGPALGQDANIPIAVNQIAQVGNPLTDIVVTVV